MWGARAAGNAAVPCCRALHGFGRPLAKMLRRKKYVPRRPARGGRASSARRSRLGRAALRDRGHGAAVPGVFELRGLTLFLRPSPPRFSRGWEALPAVRCRRVREWWEAVGSEPLAGNAECLVLVRQEEVLVRQPCAGTWNGKEMLTGCDRLCREEG